MALTRLADIVGQEEAVAAAQQALTRRRKAHAMLFAGPAGVGRRTTATALAAALLCSRSGEGEEAGFRDACAGCEDCRMMASESHPDFHPIYKELARHHPDPDVRSKVMQELSIDVIREFLIKPAHRAATRARGKVFVVRQAELMSEAAQNSLLKTLEEPPPGVTIILLTDRPDRLLPTTLSRCRLVRFVPLPAGFVKDRLVDGGVSPQQAAFWAAATGGSLGRAIRLSEAGLYDVKCELVDRLGRLTPAGDGELADRLIKLMEELSSAAIAEAKRLDGGNLSRNLASRQAVGTILELLAGVYRDALNLRAGANLPLVHTDQAPAVSAIADRMSLDQLAEVLQQLSEYERLLWRNVNPKIIWDNVVITCATAATLRL